MPRTFHSKIEWRHHAVEATVSTDFRHRPWLYAQILAFYMMVSAVELTYDFLSSHISVVLIETWILNKLRTVLNLTQDLTKQMKWQSRGRQCWVRRGTREWRLTTIRLIYFTTTNTSFLSAVVHGFKPSSRKAEKTVRNFQNFRSLCRHKYPILIQKHE